MKAIYLEEAVDRFIEQGANLDKDQIIYILNRLPYMEIVRCKDCRYWQPHTQYGFDEDNEEFHNYCGRLIPEDEYYAFTREAEDFCSYGERSEDE